MDGQLHVSDIYSINDVGVGLTQRYKGHPLMGSSVAAGFPSPADDFIDRPLDLNEYLIGNPSSTFFVRVSGDSMQGAGIHHNDILIVDKSLKAGMGQVVIAVLDGEMLVKRLKRVKEKVFLMPENDKFAPIEINEDRDCAVWGVVTYVIHPV